MDFYTDCVGVQFYSVNFIEEHLGKNGVTYNSRQGFCLEPHYFPNAVNEEKFVSPIIQSGETYQVHTKICFYNR